MIPGRPVPGPRPVHPAGILAAELARLVDRLGAVAGLDPSILADAERARDLAGGLDPYIESCTTPESPALAALVEATRAEDWSRLAGRGLGLEQEMVSGHVEGQVLRFLVRATGARRILEVGMFTGYSALAMAEALPDDGRVTACEIDPDVAAFAAGCFRASASGHKIDVRIGPALATLKALDAEGATFDLVFVDADKAGYRSYVDAVLDGGLLAPGGAICVDNTLMQGQPWLDGPRTANGDAIADFNATLAADGRVEQVLVPLRDGLTLIQRAGVGK